MTWCTKRPYHCYILTPRHIYKPSSSLLYSSSKQARSISSSSVPSASSNSQSPWNSRSWRSTSNPTTSNSADHLDALHLLDQDNIHGRWIQTDGTAGMRARSAELFYQQHGEWFYVGTFKACRLPDLAPDEFVQLDDRVRFLCTNRVLLAVVDSLSTYLFIRQNKN